ncbi:MAG: hypothetical protein HYT79_02895 [Elusimicrobia bacterium]|nr:hypothetical protein [Elusimicrobiota bacterium]
MAEQADNPGKLLLYYTGPLSTETSASTALAFGLVFFGLGVLCLVLGLGPFPEVWRHTPVLLLLTFGATMLSLSLGLLHFSVKKKSRENALECNRELHPQEPWLWDYDWDFQGIADGSGRRLARYWIETWAMGVFLALVHWVTFLDFERLFGLLIVALIFDCFWLFGLYRTVKATLGRRRFGSAYLRFKKFPYHPGEQAAFELVLGSNARDLEHLTLTLRQIEVGRIKTPDNERQTAFFERHADQIVLDKNAIAQHIGIPATFNIPRDAVGTRRETPNPVHWELMVEGKAPGVDLETCFFVPIYDRP